VIRAKRLKRSAAITWHGACDGKPPIINGCILGVRHQMGRTPEETTVHRLVSWIRLGVLGSTLVMLPLSAARADEQAAEELLLFLPIAPAAELGQARAGMPATPELPPLTTSVILWDEARPPLPPIRHTADQASVVGQMNTFQK
jgi:hypothetical protein